MTKFGSLYHVLLDPISIFIWRNWSPCLLVSSLQQYLYFLFTSIIYNRQWVVCFQLATAKEDGIALLWLLVHIHSLGKISNKTNNIECLCSHLCNNTSRNMSTNPKAKLLNCQLNHLFTFFFVRITQNTLLDCTHNRLTILIPSITHLSSFTICSSNNNQ